MKILNKTTGRFLAENAKLANTFWTRLVGLLNRSSLSPSEALIITRCQSIHMFFMRFPIDVIFLDSENRVVGLVKNIQPFRLSPHFFKASYAIELPAGTIDHTQTALGHWIKTED